MKQVIFRRVATSIITPTSQTGVDYKKLAKLLDWQITQEIDAVVVCGTTGESSTLSDAEHRRVIDFSVQHVAGRVPVIASTGSNVTTYALSLTRHAALQCRYHRLAASLFCEDLLRTPLTPMEDDHRARLRSDMRKAGLAV